MIEFLSGASLWSRLEKTSASANKRTAAIAYLTLDNLRFSAGDMLIVDAGDSSIGSARTSAALLKKLHKRGVGLFSYDRLHAKVIVLDREIFASSANASKSSKENLFEAGIVTDSPSARAQAVADIHNLSKVSIRIDQEFIARIEKIGVLRGPLPVWASTLPQQIAHSSRTWLLGVHAIADPKDPLEIRRIEQTETRLKADLNDDAVELSWCKFSKNSRVAREARAGDNLILIWRDKTKSDPKVVYRHQVVLRNEAFPTSNRLFYVQEEEKENGLSWSKFRRLVSAIEGFPEPRPNMQRALTGTQDDAMKALWTNTVS